MEQMKVQFLSTLRFSEKEWHIKETFDIFSAEELLLIRPESDIFGEEKQEEKQRNVLAN